MTDRDDDLTRNIRDLLGRAIADTPPSPRLDEGITMSPTPTDRNDRNRWIIGGLAGLSVAAAIVALFVFARPDEVADPQAPATDPATPIDTIAPAPTPDSAPTTVPATTPPTSAPAAIEPSVSTTTPPTTEQSTPPETTEPAPTVVGFSEMVVAGPDGVRRGDDVVTTQPMARALPLSDGRMLMQRQFNQSGAVAESALLVVEPGASEPVPLVVPTEFDGVVLRLHDVAVIGGETVVIVETRPDLCANPTDCVGALWAFGPDSGRLDQLQEKIVWEGGWSRVSLASTGVAFGTETESATRTLRSWIIPGSRAEPIDIGREGLAPSYGDCTDCPTGFTIDTSGTHLAWVETDLTTFQTTLVFANLGEDDVKRVPLVDAGTVCCLDGVGPDLPIIPVVEFDLSVVGDTGSIRAVVNDEGVLNGDDPRPALVVDIATGEVTAADGFHVFG